MTNRTHKDYFSGHANIYAAFRPVYPAALYDFLFQYVHAKDIAWDCATGNGQVANFLAGHFKAVYATDISQQQLDNAIVRKNIFYSLRPAEKSDFPDQQFDLITVGQALHWFDRARFYDEVRRVCRPGGLLAAWGYAFININPTVDNLISNFYGNTVGPYWDQARRLVEDEYRTIEFPFKEIATPKFFITVKWDLQHLAGYLESWSATQKYIKGQGKNPVPELMNELRQVWHSPDVKTVRFPVFLRLARIH